MQRAATRVGLGLGLGLLAAVVRAQLTPVSPPVPIEVPVPATVVDTSKKPVTGLVPDTTRVVIAPAAEPTEKLTRPLTIRIAVVIVVLTLTTFLLYNVRSR